MIHCYSSNLKGAAVSTVMLLMLLCCPSAMQAFDYGNLPTTAGSTLKGNNIYTITQNTEIKGDNSAALRVEAGATTTIYIPAGLTLTVRGANGNGKACGYAGIEVPKGATLIITGEGSLYAYGGNAGAGGDGGSGSNGSIDIDGNKGYPGAGGDGGYGGGGAAAGIGGNGGNGHDAQAGPTMDPRTCDTDNYDCSGKDGSNTQDGESGEAMGKVYIIGSVRVYAYYGNTEASAGSAGTSGNNGDDNNYWKWWRRWSAGGGGAGGGGGTGYAAEYGIGGGGAGGQCGATGGTGGTYWRGHGSSYEYLHGGSGQGGNGSKQGGYYGNTRSSYGDKNGGNGGSATDNQAKGGEKGSLNTSSTVKLNIDGNRSSDKTVDGHDTLKVTVALDANVGDVTSAGTKSVTMWYGVMPKQIEMPKKTGFFCMGYYTDKKDGERIFDEEGNPLHVCTDITTTQLYAQWSKAYISTKEQYLAFCDSVNSGKTPTENGKFFLDADIDLGTDFVRIGTAEHPFKGTFDGQGYYIKVDYSTTTEAYAAPFAYVNNATIKNLKVTGSIVSSAKYAASFVGNAVGVTLENCISDVSITSKVKGDGTNGGLIAEITSGGNNFDIRNCAFVGTFSGSNTSSWGGLVGYTHQSGTFKGCFIGNVFRNSSNLPSNTNSNTIVRNNASKCDVSEVNCCYHQAFQDNAWGTAGDKMTNDQFKDGALCYFVNGNSANGAWYQNIGEDTIPTFDSTHMKVFKDYDSATESEVCHNRSYMEMTNDMVFEIGYTPNERTQIYEVYEAMGENKSNGATKVVETTYDAYSYLYNAGNITVDDVPQKENSHIYSGAYDIGTVPLFLQSDCRLYEYTIMENSVILHHFIPSIYNKVMGLFDTVERKHYTIKGAKVFLDKTVIPCQHEYSVSESLNGQTGSHCYVCDNMFQPSYYVYAVYDGNGASGAMGSEMIEPGGKLKKNEYARKNYLFNGWQAFNKSGKPIASTIYADEAALTINKSFCDTITFKAQWADAFSYNGSTLLINDANTANIEIVDDSIHGFSAAKAFKAEAISYTRSVPAESHWGSLCLPFAISGTSASFPEGSEGDAIVLFKTGSITKDASTGRESIHLTPCEVVEAGVPCMFYFTHKLPNISQKITFKATNADVVAEPKTVASDGLTFNGVLESLAFKCDTTAYSYYGVQNDIFYKVGTSYVVKPYYTYMTMPVSSGAKTSYFITFDGDDTTAVKEVNGHVNVSDGIIYDLSGRRVKAASNHGIYIINGKKYTK